jgi:hypothetical protein
MYQRIAARTASVRLNFWRSRTLSSAASSVSSSAVLIVFFDPAVTARASYTV